MNKTKQQLKYKLDAISNNYVINDSWKTTFDCSSGDFIECLNNLDPANHLMESELCPVLDEQVEHFEDFKDFDDIVEQYQLSLEHCFEAGMISRVPKLKLVEASYG